MAVAYYGWGVWGYALNLHIKLPKSSLNKEKRIRITENSSVLMTYIKPEKRKGKIPKSSAEKILHRATCWNEYCSWVFVCVCVCVTVHVFVLRSMKSENPLLDVGKYSWYCAWNLCICKFLFYCVRSCCSKIKRKPMYI